MRTAYYHKLTVSGELSFCVKTLSPDLTAEQAAAVAQKANGLDKSMFQGQTLTISSLSPESRDARCLQANIILDTLPDGTRFFRQPGATVNITVTRIDRNDTQGTLTDILSVPSFLVNSDCTGAAVRRLFRQVAEDFVDTYGDAQSVFPFFRDGILDWNSFFKLPEEWLAGYGITITPIDTYLALDVGMDENMAAEDA